MGCLVLHLISNLPKSSHSNHTSKDGIPTTDGSQTIEVHTPSNHPFESQYGIVSHVEHIGRTLWDGKEGVRGIRTVLERYRRGIGIGEV